MKRNLLTIVVGLLLLVIFALLLFVFQVRQNEVAVVTTFGQPTRPITQPGAYFKWPWPVQKVTKLDQRIQNFESKFEETLTADQRQLLIMVYIGWKIADPALFYNSFANGSVAEAERSLDGLVRSAKGKIGQHPFSDFVSTDEKNLKFVETEKEMLDEIQVQSRSHYGIEIRFLGIKRIQLPESITQKVFDRMTAERKKEADRLLAEGEEQASKIQSAARLERDELLAKAEAEATRIRGEGDAKAAESFSVFQQDPELALFIMKLNSLEQILKERATLILDPRTPPFDLLIGSSTNFHQIELRK